MHKELPFKNTEMPVKINEGWEHNVFELKLNKEKEYILKEIYSDFALGRYKGKTLEKKIAEMKIIFDILRNHYKDKIVQTYFIIGKNSDNKPCIMKVQEKIKGDILDELEKYHHDDPRLKKALKQLMEIEQDVPVVISEIQKCSRFQNYSTEDAMEMIFDVNRKGNAVVDNSGNITVVDW